MNSSARRSGAFVALGLAGLLTGCGAPSGLGKSEPAPPASAQPLPETLWPEWSPKSTSPSDAVTDPELQPAPEPLAGAPAVPADGFASLDQLEVLRADPRMKRLTRRGPVDRPGRPGVRPPVLHDLTGDERPEMISAVDLESGRVLIAVYTVRTGQIVPILHTSGLRPVVEAVGTDLVVRSSQSDGGEQTVRYRWDGTRMITVSEVRDYPTDGDRQGGTDGGATAGPDVRPSQAPRGGTPQPVAPRPARPPAATPGPASPGAAP
ncbi:hypothetical protein ACFYVL_18925 [Streptomyces sp. NPDC004111]|uniref:hypothetical protein n=1 Tax=Streptomyces sp. NPDC004111 TaxID=3364690 RepID=UPI0036895472